MALSSASLPEILETSIQRSLSEIHTCIPGKIQSYDHKTQKATVLPLIKKKYRDGVVESMPPIVSVPVVFPRTIEASLTMPVKGGDGVIILFSERSMERFLSLGDEQEPGDARKFDLTDGIAIPGLFPFSTPSLSENNDDVLLIYKDTKMRMTKDGNFELEVPKDIIVKVEGNGEVEIKGNLGVKIEGDNTVEIGGNCEVKVGGDCNVQIDGNCDVQVGGNVTVNIDGQADITVSGNVNLTAPETNIKGNVNVEGDVNVTGTVTADTDVVGGGISLKSHTHPGIEPGSGNTGAPQ